MKKILSLTLVLLLAIAVMAGCGGKKSDTNLPTASADDGIFSTADVKFVDSNGEAVYRFIRADGNEKWFTTNQFIVDYVHLYQLKEGVQQLVLNGEMQ